ncbi:8-amino-7-oxononanoate synthase-like [Hibiscus syriacus]|uniref:8-amino-7-oxononanoate synthase-like n=1 Tax=Hibiscus syriacus TaxID=106335 RepID=UPI00192199C5|nr:8-amino-7-oxononanoate synthase-like [Hibiscus syriacus]
MDSCESIFHFFRLMEHLFGEEWRGLAEEFNCEYDVDISIGTLSKTASSLGGFVTCSKIWKQWIQSRGSSFIFSTIAPIPLAAASYASVVVAKKESWRRREIQNRMKELHALTGIPVKSQIVCVMIGDMMQAIKARQFFFFLTLLSVSYLSIEWLSDHLQSLRIQQGSITTPTHKLFTYIIFTYLLFIQVAIDSHFCTHIRRYKKACCN